MKRRFGMWIGILCILVVGVSVTRMTKEFVVSKGVAASSIISVMDAGVSGAAFAGGAQDSAAAENRAAFRIPAPEAGAGGADMEIQLEAAPAPTEAAAVAGSTEDFDMNTSVTSGEDSPAEGGMEDSMMKVTPELAEEELADTPAVAAVGLDPMASAAEAYPGDMEPSETEVADDLKMEAAAIQETVKSPLDPVVETQAILIETKAEVVVYVAEDYLNRLETAEASSKALWEKVTADNMVAYYATADQERVLWDYELNLVYGAIRERLSEKEADELKHLELDWMKERDQYAEKVAAKSPVMNAQNQNPVYIRALTEKTKERCYWLVSEYEEVLNREE